MRETVSQVFSQPEAFSIELWQGLSTPTEPRRFQQRLRELACTIATCARPFFPRVALPATSVRRQCGVTLLSSARYISALNKLRDELLHASLSFCLSKSISYPTLCVNRDCRVSWHTLYFGGAISPSNEKSNSSRTEVHVVLHICILVGTKVGALIVRALMLELWFHVSLYDWDLAHHEWYHHPTETYRCR